MSVKKMYANMSPGRAMPDAMRFNRSIV